MAVTPCLSGLPELAGFLVFLYEDPDRYVQSCDIVNEIEGSTLYV